MGALHKSYRQKISFLQGTEPELYATEKFLDLDFVISELEFKRLNDAARLFVNEIKK